jgi:putative addiction module component (TIGR02574 family)
MRRAPVAANVSRQGQAESCELPSGYTLRHMAIDIETLSPEERLKLLEKLWDSLSSSPDAVPLTEPQREELDRRLDELDREGPGGIPWEEVQRRISTRRT